MALDALKAELERKKAAAASLKAVDGALAGKKYMRRGELEALRSAASVSTSAAAPSAAAAVEDSPALADAAPSTVSARAPAHISEASEQRPPAGGGEGTAAEHAAVASTDDTSPSHDRKRPRLDADAAVSNDAVPDDSTTGAAGDDAASTGGARDRCTSRDAERFKGVDAQKYCYKFFKGLLNEWEAELAGRSAADAASREGRAASVTFQQTVDYMRPFYRHCRKRTLQSDIVSLCSKIVDHCLERLYNEAGNVYVKLAIGNAAWPIGVTQAGLHERAAREKVQEGKQAHAMHDEEQRKYITSIKRLMTYAQKKYPADPSHSMYT